MRTPDIRNRAFEIRASSAGFGLGEKGVLLAWGSRFGGLVLFVLEGRFVFAYAYSDTVTLRVTSDVPIPAGTRRLAVRVVPDGRGGAEVTMHLDDRHAGSLSLPALWPPHGVTAGITCGYDGACPVSDAYSAPFRFTGEGLCVEMEVDPDTSIAREAAA